MGGMSATEGTTIEAGFYRHLVCATVLTCDRNYPYPYSDGHRGAARSYDDSGRCCPSSPLRHDYDTRTLLWHTFQQLSPPAPSHSALSFSRHRGARPPARGGAASESAKLGLPGAARPGDWPCPNCHNVNWAKRDTCNMCNTPRLNLLKSEGPREGRGGGYMEREEVAKKQFNDEEEEYDEFGRKKKKSAGTRPYYGH